MPLVPFFIHMIDNIGRVRAHHRTERIMNSLPLAIQKDIGWPSGWPGAAEACSTPMYIAARNSLGIRPGKG